MMSPIGIIDAGYNMDSGYVYAKFITGDIVLIDCDKVEKTYADNMYERSELDYLIWNDPAAYVELILDNEVEKYLKKAIRYIPLSSSR
jgi:hypothetical protein